VRLTYAQLGDAVDECARAIVASGLEPGDRVAVWAPNCWQWVVASLGALRAGAVFVPVNTRFKGAEAAEVLRRASVRMLFTVTGFLDADYPAMLAPHRDELPHLDTVVVMAGDARDATVGWHELLGRAAGATSDEVRRRSDAVAHDDVSLLMFTSGTTGHPKGVMVRGGAMVRLFAPYSAELGVRRGDRYLLVNPFFHAFGFNSGIVCCLMRGATILPVAVYEPEAVLQLIESERVAVFPGPPALYQGLLNHPDLDRYDISSLRSCLTGAATIPTELVIAMRERLGFEVVLTGYGLTETTGLATQTRAGDPPEIIAGTSGRAVPDVEVKVVDDQGVELPAGQPGEILVRGYQIMAGYLDDPAATAETIDADGWLRTGDIGVLDEDGNLDITDRKKDMYIVGGFNAYPAEIERMLVEHPGVAQVAVIGVPDDRLGEVGAAFVLPAHGARLDEVELITWARDRMANYKTPRYVWTVESMPLTASNKIHKPTLRDRALDLLAEPG
jgi:acyl-CoA synthetase (AMP-forming)/AMP-acid ligase II